MCKKILIFISLCIINFYTLSCKSINSNVHITGGVDASNYYHGVVKLMDEQKNAYSGVIVSHNVILTAAHCLEDVPDGKLKAILKDGREITAKAQLFNKEYLKPYGYYKGFGHVGNNFLYDIAVIIFDDHSFDNLPQYKI